MTNTKIILPDGMPKSEAIIKLLTVTLHLIHERKILNYDWDHWNYRIATLLHIEESYVRKIVRERIEFWRITGNMDNYLQYVD
jgi:hypothetical protein